MRLRHQALEVIDETGAAVLRILIMTPEVNGLLGTHFLAIPAENAAEFIDLEHERIAIPFLILARHELDAVRRAHRRAESAGDALRLARLGGQHPVRPAP